jgi:hypothetical protein
MRKILLFLALLDVACCQCLQEKNHARIPEKSAIENTAPAPGPAETPQPVAQGPTRHSEDLTIHLPNSVPDATIILPPLRITPTCGPIDARGLRTCW